MMLMDKTRFMIHPINRLVHYNYLFVEEVALCTYGVLIAGRTMDHEYSTVGNKYAIAIIISITCFTLHLIRTQNTLFVGTSVSFYI